MGSYDKKPRKSTGSFSDRVGPKRPSHTHGSYTKNKTLTKVSCFTCGQTCQVPFRPVEGKPVYCDNCFRKTDKNFKPNSKSKHLDRRHSDTRTHPSPLDQINEKLDRILKLLEPSNTSSS